MDYSKIALYKALDDLKSLVPEEAIPEMYQHTAKDGTLYIPARPYDNDEEDEDERFYCCTMSWDKAEADKLAADYQALYGAIKRIAEILGTDGTPEDEALPAELQSVWNTYLRDFETGDMDTDPVWEIGERLEIVKDVQKLSARLAAGEELSEYEMELYNSCRDAAVTEEELALYTSYRNAVHADAERRLGDAPANYEIVIRAKRLRRLLALAAPAFISNCEAFLLARAMAVHTCCTKLEVITEVD